jgi:N-acetylmuramoyl-L-alanine amidase
LRLYQQAWNGFQQLSRVRFVVKFSLAALLGVLFVSVSFGLSAGNAYAQSFTSCQGGASTYVVVRGDTLGGIASRYSTNWGSLASYNHIANPNFISVNQIICITSRGTASSNANTGSPVQSAPATNTLSYSSPASPGGYGNVFPYGQCTWWADQRYYQLHGVFVPWTTRSDAWQWTARAYEFGWHVSGSPSVGSIIDLQPWVQGAYGGGHVAVVERILSNGHVIASNMNWGRYPWQVTYVEFAPGPGVTFISR